MRQGLRVARAELEGCPLMLPLALSQPFWKLVEHLWCLKLGERGWVRATGSALLGHTV